MAGPDRRKKTALLWVYTLINPGKRSVSYKLFDQLDSEEGDLFGRRFDSQSELMWRRVTLNHRVAEPN